MVSASLESYWFTANAHSFFLYFLSFFLLSLLSIFLPQCFFPSKVTPLLPSPSALPHPCVLWHPTPAQHGRGLAPAYSVLDLSHVTLTCYVLQGCRAVRGPLRKRAAFTSGRKQSKSRRGEGECVSVRVWVGRLCGWGIRKQYFKRWNSAIKSLTSRSVQTCCIVVGLRWKTFDQSSLIFLFFFFSPVPHIFLKSNWHAKMSSGLNLLSPSLPISFSLSPH